MSGRYRLLALRSHSRLPATPPTTIVQYQCRRLYHSVPARPASASASVEPVSFASDTDYHYDLFPPMSNFQTATSTTAARLYKSVEQTSEEAPELLELGSIPERPMSTTSAASDRRNAERIIGRSIRQLLNTNTTNSAVLLLRELIPHGAVLSASQQRTVYDRVHDVASNAKRSDKTEIATAAIELYRAALVSNDTQQTPMQYSTTISALFKLINGADIAVDTIISLYCDLFDRSLNNYLTDRHYALIMKTVIAARQYDLIWPIYCGLRQRTTQPHCYDMFIFDCTLYALIRTRSIQRAQELTRHIARWKAQYQRQQAQQQQNIAQQDPKIINNDNSNELFGKTIIPPPLYTVQTYHQLLYLHLLRQEYADAVNLIGQLHRNSKLIPSPLMALIMDFCSEQQQWTLLQTVVNKQNLLRERFHVAQATDIVFAAAFIRALRAQEKYGAATGADLIALRAQRYDLCNNQQRIAMEHGIMTVEERTGSLPLLTLHLPCHSVSDYVDQQALVDLTMQCLLAQHERTNINGAAATDEPLLFVTADSVATLRRLQSFFLAAYDQTMSALSKDTPTQHFKSGITVNQFYKWISHGAHYDHTTIRTSKWRRRNKLAVGPEKMGTASLTSETIWPAAAEECFRHVLLYKQKNPAALAALVSALPQLEARVAAMMREIEAADDTDDNRQSVRECILLHQTALILLAPAHSLSFKLSTNALTAYTTADRWSLSHESFYQSLVRLLCHERILDLPSHWPTFKRQQQTHKPAVSDAPLTLHVPPDVSDIELNALIYQSLLILTHESSLQRITFTAEPHIVPSLNIHIRKDCDVDAQEIAVKLQRAYSIVAVVGEEKCVDESSHQSSLSAAPFVPFIPVTVMSSALRDYLLRKCPLNADERPNTERIPSSWAQTGRVHGRAALAGSMAALFFATLISAGLSMGRAAAEWAIQQQIQAQNTIQSSPKRR